MSNIGYLKIALSALILIGALVFSYFSFFSSLPALGDSKKSAAENLNPLANVKNPIKWTGGLKNSISSTFQNSVSSIENNNSNDSSNFLKSNNLTDLVAQSMFNSMKALDAKGENPFESNNLKNKKLIEESIAGLSNPYSAFNQLIDEKKILVSSDNSLESQIKYYENYQKIIRNNFGDFKKESKNILSDAFQSNDFSTVRRLAEIYKSLTDNFLNLSAPSSLLEFHKKIIQHYQNSFMVYQAIGKYLEDPVKAYLAVQFVPRLYEETSEIQNLFEKILKERIKEFNL